MTNRQAGNLNLKVGNPYIAGNPVGGSPAFIGRDNVLQEVVRVLEDPNQNAIILYGQRRIGKTSVLQELVVRLSDTGLYYPILFDLQDKAARPLPEVLEKLAMHLAQQLELAPPDSWGKQAPHLFKDEFLPSILTRLPAKTSLVLLFDEFDVLDNPAEAQASKDFFPYLRQLLSLDPQRLQFVFVIGRRPDDLSSVMLSIFKGKDLCPVSLFSSQETVDLVRLSERNKTLHWSDDAVQQVYELTGGHPLLTQSLCYAIFRRCRKRSATTSSPVQVTEVEAAVSITLRRATSNLEWLWDGLGPAERVVASALATAGSRAIPGAELEQRLHRSGVRILIGELRDAPRVLQDWDMIEPVNGGYRFRVELLRRWIVDRKPLDRVREELDRIQPLAENLFQAAHTYYQQGDQDGAISLLRQAISHNPNHLRANQLLAEILLAQGELTEARQILERLYDYQPAVAQPRLVQVLLEQAKAANKNEDEQLAFYERVLHLEKRQPEALARLTEIWRRRGEAALASGNLEEAREVYQKAQGAGLKKQALGQIEPTAKNFYQIAYDLYRREELNRALEPLRRSVDLEDNNPATLELLVDILLAQKQVDEARQRLENIRSDDPDLARPHLIKILLWQADNVEEDDEKLKLYEQVLQLEPEHREAAANWRLIWQKRGERAEEANDLETALSAYRQAGLSEKIAEIEARLVQQYLKTQFQEIRRLERKGNYQEALDLARQLHHYPQEQPYPDLERLERQAEAMNLYTMARGAMQNGERQKAISLLAEAIDLEPKYLEILYQDALTALKTGEQKTAQELLVQALMIKPDYREAARYYFEATTGVDVLALQRQAADLQTQLQEKTNAPTLKFPTLLDYLRLGWALFLDPDRFAVYQQRFGLAGLRGLGKWLISTLIWLPFFLPALALSFSVLPGPEAMASNITFFPSLSLILITAWLITGLFGHSDNREISLIAFAITAAATCYVVFRITVDIAGGIPFGLATLAAGIVVVGAALSVAGYVAFSTAFGVAIGVAGGLIFGWIGGGVEGVAASGVAVLIVTGLVYRLHKGVENSLKNNFSYWLMRGSLGALTLAYAFIVWYAFLGGWRLFL